MNEKIKVPKWFDEWHKSFEQIKDNDLRFEVSLYYLVKVGLGSGLVDGSRNRFDSDNVEHKEINNYTLNNKKKLVRAILDGYEVEEEYIEIDPFEAYERFFKYDNVYSNYKSVDGRYKKTNISEFTPANIKDFDIKFYIKKENEQC